MIYFDDMTQITITTEDVQAVLTAVQDIETLLLVICGLLCLIFGILCGWLLWRRTR